MVANGSLQLGFAGDTVIPGYTQAFSSYPGAIFSGDDFYILSSGLVSSVFLCLPFCAVLDGVGSALSIGFAIAIERGLDGRTLS